MHDHEFSISIGVRHPDIDPARITLELGLQPGHRWKSGEQRLDHAGSELGGNHRESYWLCEIPLRPKFAGERISVESELASVLQTLRKSIGFLQDLRRGGGSVDLFVTVFARGDFRLELLPDTAALLARSGLSLTVEIRSGRAGAAAAAAGH